MDSHILLIITTSGIVLSLADGDFHHLRGPSFLMEPPSKLEFSNSSGGWLDCSASGSPPPALDWLSVDGNSVGDVPGVRRVLRNGTLVLLPFSAEAYRQDIHNTVYRCVAQNAVGRILSRDVQVRAVVTQAYKVAVEVLGAARGCTAILQCVVDRSVRDMVKVVSWVQEPSFFIYPSLQGDGKFHVLPSGELLVHNVEFSDQFPSYRCRTRHRLTRQVEVSSPANVRIQEHRGIVSPAMVEHSPTVQVSHDEGAVLLCLAQGCPTPDYRWYHLQPGYEAVSVVPGPRARVLGPVLAIEAVTEEDAGLYRCSASNAGGEASAELRLVVTNTLHVEVSPTVLSVHLGGSGEFRCIVSPPGTYLTTWFKDGRVLPGMSSGDTLVLNGINREDQGMYQCLVRRAEGETAQGAAELQLGDASPALSYTFIEQTLQPGPAVSLKCSAQGNPTPQITWALDGFSLPNNVRFMIGQYLTIHGDVISHVNISNVAVEDGGEYSCTAENRAGKATHSARLNVYGLPYIRLIPKVTAVAGETFQLKCPVAGYPIEEIHWERSGRELPDDLRQKVIGGTLMISPVQKSADAGVYTCWARNKQGQSARRSGEVAVIVPPKLGPFVSDRTLHLGERASLTCSVTKGDLPLTITWFKDGKPVDPKHRLMVNQVDQFNSILLIESLSPDHNGNYTCQARNPASEVSQTQRLVVNVPPRWVVEPGDVSVERNRHVTINCQAQGVPQPVVTWKKATGSKSGEYEEIRERVYTRLLGNGSLLLQNVKEDREGFYLCQATNGIGNGIGKVVQLKVNSSPYFSAPSRVVTVKKGDTATLVCNVNGDTPINVRWMRGGKIQLTPASNYRLTMKQDITPDGVTAELQISSTESADTGAYFCQASNLFGKDQQLVQLLVQEPPESPSDLKTVMVSSRTANIQWHHQSGEVTRFIVQYKEGDGVWQQLELSGQLRGALLENLKPATRYSVHVQAEGPAGRSKPSQDLQFKTEPQRPAGPPLNVAVRAVSSTQLLVTWAPPLPELRHGDIQGYYVGYREINSPNGNYNMTAVSGVSDEGGGELILSGLLKFTRYSLVVQAFNQVGQGPQSEPVSAQTMEDVPSAAPEDVRCAALSSQSVQVSWHPPPHIHSNGIIQGYRLFYDTHDQVLDLGMDSRKTTAMTIVLTGLMKFTNYSVQVLAFTRVGDGVPSRPIFCQTEEDAPGSPADIKVAVSSSNSLVVSWLPPNDPNGLITKYNLYTRVVDGREELNHGKRNLPSQHMSYEAKGLQPHVEYQFWVTASTRVGEGQSSRVVAQVPTSRVPAKITSFGGLVLRPWRSSVSLPCHVVGAPQPRREWLRDDRPLQISTGHNIQLMESGEVVISGLQRADSDNYTCHAENNIGSDSIYYTLVVQVPPSAPVLYVTSATSSSILLHWKAGDNGNAAITAYTLNYRRAHADLEELTLSRRTTSYELKGLMCGSTYHIYLSTHNRLGSSPPSPTLSVRTQGQYPSVPPASTFLTPNSSSVMLRLHVWPDNGCPLLYFVVRYRPVNNPEWILVSNNLKPQRRFVMTGLLPSSEYQLQVEAHNIAGSSTGEYTFYTLTKDGDLPPPELVRRGQLGKPFYTDFRVLLPLLVATLGILGAASAFLLCRKTRRERRPVKETLDNQQNAEAQRERYYATIHKVALQANSDKIPETSEDISPYATFQLADPNNTLLHSFMYHEQAMTEGCASPPPPGVRYPNPPSSKSRRARRRSSRKTDAETDESDSEGDQLTSSRTESSNQLDANKARQSQYFIYHGAQSSTSSDISPMSEQKSLPRRGGRSRWLSPGKSAMRTSLSIAETSFRGAPAQSSELSEAECDIDTLKKLKLGLRSSLWSRPSNHTQSSDYSIAV
ncbi:Down syndrome cell adhesion molecule-like protein Dscam2 isoform X2 [Homalodisca vitripennis]|uniref:Down syndrome cell adhesion molecule-like protein Dscam2 isoform X2 n=1 Tax=Homalodisca vitripennis TaxID=197043 RepID=UPI001EEBFF15|nr:Down syndrome cell adhesion molecule-like protein Dscam2 isoform X2 [Homalodisca vitripennis]